MVGAKHTSFHLPPQIPQEEIDQGFSRFYQWRFDATPYCISPPRVGSLLAVRTPKGLGCTVRWEDEEGQTMEVGPGTTACKYCTMRKSSVAMYGSLYEAP